tara:strand:- start:911 stop:1024 length:114 start_codon:yes stop_codon:yes gene_type:complete
MTMEQGFGMLGVGLVAILIAAIIIYFVINKIKQDDLD